jgi:hypothetical protein
VGIESPTNKKRQPMTKKKNKKKRINLILLMKTMITMRMDRHNPIINPS